MPVSDFYYLEEFIERIRISTRVIRGSSYTA